MKQPIRERIKEVISLMGYCMSDITFLLDNYDESLVKEYVLYLLELHEKYGKELRELSKRLENQQYFDHQYINPKYKASYKAEQY